MTVKKLDEIWFSLERTPLKSFIRWAAQSAMTLGSAHMAMRLHWLPRKIAAVQRLANPVTY
jgi:hypothetical protein